MSQSLEEIRAKSKTSIHGRRLGLDHDEFLVGIKDIRKVITDATSDTTGTNLPNHGLVSVVTTTNDTWILTDPIPGVPVTIVTNSTSTGTHQINCANATIDSTIGSTGNTIEMTSQGAYITLSGLTTDTWAMVSRASTAVVQVKESGG